MQSQTALVPFPRPTGQGQSIYALVQSGTGGLTLRDYEDDWRNYAQWANQPTVESAIRALAMGTQGNAQAAIWAYRQNMIDGKYAPSTINRRLCAMRYIIKVCRRSGMIDWTIEVPGLKTTNIKDTRGPGREGMQRMLERTTDPQHHLVLRLLHDMALRRREVVNLMMEDYTLIPIPPRLWVLNKGKLEKEPFTVPKSVQTAIEEWLKVRGNAPGSLLGLSYQKIARIVDKAAIRAGILSAHPHGLRHAGISLALELTNGNLRAVQRFARHSKPETTARYDDNRTDAFGEVSNLVGNDKIEESPVE